MSRGSDTKRLLMVVDYLADLRRSGIWVLKHPVLDDFSIVGHPLRRGHPLLPDGRPEYLPCLLACMWPWMGWVISWENN